VGTGRRSGSLRIAKTVRAFRMADLGASLS
jgi:hypothetical protein